MTSRRLATSFLLLVLLAGSFLPRTATAEDAPAATLRGQVVCSECWFEADRKTVPYGDEADLACAARCAKTGIPPALAVREGSDLTLYLLRGKPPKGSKWLDHMGKFAA